MSEGEYRLRVISDADWEVKDADPRTVPICHELQAYLLEAFEQAPDGEPLVIPKGSFSVCNASRWFTDLAKRADVVRYGKPLHTLRKSCITDWAKRFPMHVVKEWAGHSDSRTTEQHYFRVSDSEYELAAREPDVAQLVAQQGGDEPERDEKRSAKTSA